MAKNDNKGEKKQTLADHQDFKVQVEGIDLVRITETCISKYVEKNLPLLHEKKIEPFLNKVSAEATAILTQTKKETSKILHELVLAEVAKLKPTLINIAGRTKVEVKGKTHQAFTDCLFICEQERQLYIAGSAGSGKTTIAEHIAKAFNLECAHISCSAGLSEGHLLGRMLFDGKYMESDFVRMYEKGGVFLFDEIDAADSNTMLVVNSALANNYLSVPNRAKNPIAKRHPDFICVCAANTWGHGSFEYHGRNNLDAAFLDRFALAKVQIGYDTDLEKEIAKGHEELLKCLWEARANVLANRMRRVISTRAIVSGVRHEKAGKNLKEIVERLTLDYTQEEKSKIFPHVINN